MARDPRSILIAVEGIDGAGKTTQVLMLKDALEALGEVVVVSKEPTNGQWGRIIKQSASEGRHAPAEELDLFIKDRTEHVSNLISPALERGETVILDRYFYSTIAYQGCRGMVRAEVEERMRSLFPVPDAVFILDIEPELSTFRIAHSRGEEPNHFEERGNLARARDLYQLKGPEIYFIDGSGSRTLVRDQIVDRFIRGPLKAHRCAKSYGCDNEMDCTVRLTGKCEWFNKARSLMAITKEV